VLVGRKKSHDSRHISTGRCNFLPIGIDQGGPAGQLYTNITMVFFVIYLRCNFHCCAF
jgi:hypothetical protein